jgi:hypothetical protein
LQVLRAGRSRSPGDVMRRNSMPMPTTFSEATDDLRAFLRREGRPDRIAWVFREDVAEIGSVRFIRAPAPAANAQHAERLYLRGVQRGLGVSLEAFAHTDEVTYAWVFVPTDETDAEYSMVGGEHLKLAIPQERQVPREVTNRASWWLIRLRSSANPRFKFVDLLPKRAAA